MCAEDIRVIIKLLDKSKGTRDKTFTMLREVGMANESIQTSVWMAQHNEQTRYIGMTSTRVGW